MKTYRNTTFRPTYFRKSYAEFLARGRAKHGDKFDTSDLAPAFVPFYESGERIEVEIYGETQRGRVSVTTGWKPIFLLMRRRSDVGSSYVLDAKARFIKVVSK